MLYFSHFLQSRYFIYLSVFISFWLGIHSVPLFDLDEGAFTEATREMLSSGNYITTYLNGQPRYDKPVLFYWLQALSITSFGYNEFAFRLPSALASTLSAIVIYRFVKQHYDSQYAHIATLFFTQCLWVGLIAKAAIADALLNLFIALACFHLWQAIIHRQRKQKHLNLTYFFMALGTLTKGPIAIAIPLITSFIYFLSIRELAHYYRYYFSATGWFILGGISSLYLLAIYQTQGLDFLYYFIIEHNVERFFTTRENHGGSLFYYFIALPIILLPLSLLLVPTLRQYNRIKKDALARYLAIWSLVVFTLFSFSKTQLPHYILNACIPLTILFSIVIQKKRNTTSLASIMLIPCVFFLALPEVLEYIKDTVYIRDYEYASLIQKEPIFPAYYVESSIGLTVLILVTLIISQLHLWKKLVLQGLLFNIFIFSSVAPLISNIQQRPLHNVIEHIKQHYHGIQVVHYKLNMPSFSVYQKSITQQRLPQKDELAITRIDHYQTIPPSSHVEYNVVYQYGGLLLFKATDSKTIEAKQP